jgi:hypothetical protein
MRRTAIVKRLFLLIVILLFPYFVFADNWTILRTNKPEYEMGFILQETDIVNIQEGEFLIIGKGNVGKRKLAVIIIPGEKTISQGIEEAKMLEQERMNMAFRNTHIWEPHYLFFQLPNLNYLFFWKQE